MAQIIIEVDESEISSFVKEEWFKKARHETVCALRKAAEAEALKFLDENKEDFKEMLSEALQRVLERYRIKDLSHVEDILRGKNRDGHRPNPKAARVLV